MAALFGSETTMGALMQTFEWTTSPLGPVEGWPPSLRMAVSLGLHSQFPTVIFWGPDLVMLYNDAYLPILGDKQPASLGRPARDIWPEIWSIVGPMLHGVLETGQATWSYDLFLPIVHQGAVGEHYFTFSYSPIFDETGTVCGVFCPVTETTARIVGERRQQALQHEAEAAHAQVTQTLESITDAFYTVDREWRFTYVNRHAKQLLERPQGSNPRLRLKARKQGVGAREFLRVATL
jgi:PAS domain-containing protein